MVRASVQQYLGSEKGAVAEGLLNDALQGKVATLELEPIKYAAWRYQV